MTLTNKSVDGTEPSQAITLEFGLVFASSETTLASRETQTESTLACSRLAPAPTMRCASAYCTIALGIVAAAGSFIKRAQTIALALPRSTAHSLWNAIPVARSLFSICQMVSCG
jgi:hypothetical protein